MIATSPMLWGPSGWMVVRRSDPAVRLLRDRHYSTKRPGGRTVGPPGRVVVLRTADGLAGWISQYPDPKLAMDGLDAWRCTLFRNEGPRLSSDLVREAMEATLRESGWPIARDGWVTWIEPRRIASRNPGYCFKVAGWTLDRDWTHPRLVRLRAPIEVPA